MTSQTFGQTFQIGRSLLLFALAIFSTIFAIGCGGGEHRGPGDQHSVMDQIAVESKPNNNAGLSSERWLEGVVYERVEGMNLDNLDTFFVEHRTEKIERFNCSECHSEPLSAMKSPDTGKVRAHWEVELHHASADVMNCQTCHSADAMDSVQLIGGHRLSLNQSYRLCAQCHSTQAADWVGGAHGKRRGGWAPPRVVANCASCHNPHDPGFPTRFPAQVSRVD
ncbi:MAG: cytochrome C [Ignavibacteriae bacterium]|nr:cytochrome C [Ignavibacteriota bacterium]MCB9215756.1 cytochrome C [Ignavibacteria bacterium]